MFSSEMLNFSTNNDVMLAHHKDGTVLHQESDVDQSSRPLALGNSLMANSSYAVSSIFTPSAKVSDTQNPCYWKGIGSQQSCDWIVNYANGSDGNACNQNPLFVGEILPGTVKESSLSASSISLKPGCNGFQGEQSSLTNPTSVLSSQDGQKEYGEMNFTSPSFYQNTLQEVVTSSTMGNQGFEMASPVQKSSRETGHGSWVHGGNELASRLNNTAAWMPRPMEGTHQWNDELGFAMNKDRRNLENVAGDFTGRGLSLSLSSNPPELNVAQFRERFGFESLQSRTGICSTSPDLRTDNSAYLFSESKSSVINKGYGNSVQEIVGSSTCVYPSTGPLGPFIGYATVLKNSKFLKPAQQLLDDICCVTGPKFEKACEMSDKGSKDLSILSDPMEAEIEVDGRGGNSGVSSSLFSSNEAGGGKGGVRSESCQSYHPDIQQKKAKLFYMQEEVCRSYKQYHRQMQMAVSSFESVAGLSAATPYTSLALKTISRHFRYLKNVISDQLRHISKALGGDFSSPTTATSSKLGDMTVPRFSFFNQSLHKQKAGADNLGFLEPQQPIWKPQRGLPERAVSVLKAWLFEHFLHPYPTDTDKHMLATQTGLSRNQVSNWFINARVRVWKPMVEEIHMLETKSTAGMDLNSCKNNPETDDNGNGGQNKLMIEEVGSRSECQISTGVDETLLGFVSYPKNRLEMGGLGSVSLTLGLRHSGESLQLQQQEQEAMWRPDRS